VRARHLATSILAFALLQGSLFAHRDTPLEIEGTRLIGLPDKYAPAEFDLKSRRLRIGSRVITLGGVLDTLFEEPCDVRVSASWYHEGSSLPPYILISLYPRGREQHYEILLALAALHVIKADVVLHLPRDSWAWIPIELDAQQRELLRKATEIVK